MMCEDCIHSKEIVTAAPVPKVCSDYNNEMMMVKMHSPHLINKVECKNYMSHIEMKGW